VFLASGEGSVSPALSWNTTGVPACRLWLFHVTTAGEAFDTVNPGDMDVLAKIPFSMSNARHGTSGPLTLLQKAPVLLLSSIPIASIVFGPLFSTTSSVMPKVPALVPTVIVVKRA